jgi:hypothetical protein
VLGTGLRIPNSRCGIGRDESQGTAPDNRRQSPCGASQRAGIVPSCSEGWYRTPDSNLPMLQDLIISPWIRCEPPEFLMTRCVANRRTGSNDTKSSLATGIVPWIWTFVPSIGTVFQSSLRTRPKGATIDVFCSSDASTQLSTHGNDCTESGRPRSGEC